MNQQITYLPYYLPEQYKQLLQIVDDIDSFTENWEDWNKNFIEFKSEMDKKGIECKEVIVDVEELHNYCVLNQLENNKLNRELFALKMSSILK
ncbi:MAG: hypothetical protein HOD63_13205 [Bacteroidetes bacterium]|jgi:hypothetical protein|nr:hypothetical protein [Bacteroidota bacterium]MBT3800562.1 hypothetical protein [Bacteroidota bacterium]MBT3935728.1 hypothetical protein [Bacteroidota bacterium]MBT4339544.1 hypothetical protein [Bacteroidota bacterium]MBT4729826.1 hypothetical protein [Bacteroidota bacterium]